MLYEKHFNIESFLKRYNRLVIDEIGCFENPATFDAENETELDCLKKVLSEAQAIYDTYYEDGHENYEVRLSDDLSERKRRISELNKLKRFINYYKPFLNQLTYENIEISSPQLSFVRETDIRISRVLRGLINRITKLYNEDNNEKYRNGDIDFIPTQETPESMLFLIVTEFAMKRYPEALESDEEDNDNSTISAILFEEG